MTERNATHEKRIRVGRAKPSCRGPLLGRAPPPVSFPLNMQPCPSLGGTPARSEVDLADGCPGLVLTGVAVPLF